jgi:hypothetical protein
MEAFKKHVRDLIRVWETTIAACKAECKRRLADLPPAP